MGDALQLKLETETLSTQIYTRLDWKQGNGLLTENWKTRTEPDRLYHKNEIDLSSL